MTKTELIEALAAIEHERWAAWQGYLHSKGSREARAAADQPKDLLIPGGYVEALERQIATPYADLSEDEKQSDRREVARYWPLFVGFVAGWLEEKNVNHPVAGGEAWSGLRTIAAQWRKEMEAE